MIESPGFIHLRIELTRQDQHSKYLMKTLQGILMLLPLSKSFQSLKKRLQCINIAPFELGCEEEDAKFFGERHDLQGQMSMQNCLEIFDSKQEQVSDYMIQKLQEEQQRREEQTMKPRFQGGSNQSANMSMNMQNMTNPNMTQ